MRDIERFARALSPLQIKGALKIDGDRIMGDPAVSELAPFRVQSNHRPPNAFLDRQAFANGASRAQQLFEAMECQFALKAVPIFALKVSPCWASRMGRNSRGGAGRGCVAAAVPGVQKAFFA